jgi:Tol biopolymer transport system component/actin-like ATPase involved in cell morphogenesis
VTYDLGIDLGTTFSAAAVCRDGRGEMVSLGVRRLEVPSVVFLTEEGEFLVGEPAERRGVAEPARIAREFKRRMGDPVPILVAGTPYSPQALAARVLKWIVEVTVASQGGRPTNIVVTCPANWGPFKRDVLAQVVHLAEVGAVRVATEPECAAVQYASTTRVAEGEVIAVYDLGGGTFDAAVLRKGRTGFELLGTPEGIENLGGADFDEALFGYVRATLGDAFTRLDPTDPDTTAAVARLRRECTDAKEALSSDSQATITVALPTTQTQIRITRREFEEMIEPALGDTIAAMRRVLASARVQPNELKSVVLVGGSSRIPLVGELVRQELGVATALDTHPKHAVALGAALLPSAGAATAYDLAALPPLPTVTGESDDHGLARPVVGSAPPELGPEPSAPGRRRWGLVAGIGAAVVAIAVVAALTLGGGGDDDDDGGGGTDGAAVELPRGPALPERTLAMTSGDANFEIFTLDVDTGERKRITMNNTQTKLPAMSPDRRSIAYTWDKGGGAFELWVVASNGSGQKMVARGLNPDARATWSPDGTQLAYVSDASGQPDLVVMDLATGQVDPLTNDAGIEGDPAWSPDGRSIALWKNGPEGHPVLFLLDVASKQTAQLTDEQAADPAWSPDSSKIAFARTDPDGCNDLWTIDVSTKAEERLTEDEPSVDMEDPSWSPDGRQVAFETRDSCSSSVALDIAVVGADGSDLHTVAKEAAFEFHPSWGRIPR